jgi:hypothetical protein
MELTYESHGARAMGDDLREIVQRVFRDSGIDIRLWILMYAARRKIHGLKSLCEHWEIFVGRGFSHDINSAN